MNIKIALAGAAVLGLGFIAIMISRTAPGHTVDRPADVTRGVETSEQPVIVDLAPIDQAHQNKRMVDGFAQNESTSNPVRLASPETLASRAVRGRVVDSEAQPMSGIELIYRPNSPGADLERTSSTRDGSFALQTVHSDGTVTIADAEYTPINRGVVRAGSTVPCLVIVAATGHVSGLVVDESGELLRQAHVEVELPPGFWGRFDAIFDATTGEGWSTFTGADGRFSMDDIPVIFGAQLRVTLDGYEPKAVDLGAASTASTVIELRRVVTDEFIDGVVVDSDGRPADGARVSLGQASAVTNAAGQFRLDRTGAENATMLTAVRHGALPGRVAADGTAQDGTASWPTVVIVKLGAPPLSLDGQVVDQSGAPRAGVKVWIDDPTHFGVIDSEGDELIANVEFLIDGGDAEGANWRSVTTDGEGKFRLRGLLDRPYSLQLLETQSFERARVGPFNPGEDVSVVLKSSPKHDLEGHLVSAHGDPVRGARLRLSAPAAGGIWLAYSGGETVSDEEGRFVFPHVQRGALALSIKGDNIIPLRINLNGKRTPEPIEIIVSVRCHLKLDLGPTDAADRFMVVDAEGTPLLLYDVSATGTTKSHARELIGGKSVTLGIQDTAAEVVLYVNGDIQRRIPVTLSTVDVNVIR